MREEIRSYIINDLIEDPGYALSDDEPLISGGLLDSFSLVQLQTFIDEQFGVFIDDTELTKEYINTLNAIVDLVQERQ